MSTPKSSGPEWSAQIRGLIGKLRLSQTGLAELIGVSPPTVTRWVRGSHEPTPASYMALANLVGPPDAIYFWERAGLDPANFPDPNLRAAASSLRIHLKDLRILRQGFVLDCHTATWAVLAGISPRGGILNSRTLLSRCT
jgi:transcriptional regulator with XRE-family HTH domain